MDSRNNYPSDEMDLLDYFEPLIARWKLLLVASLIGAIVVFAYSRSLPKVYQSTATIYVQQNSATSALLKNLPLNLGSSGGSSSYIMTLLQSDVLLRKLTRQFDLTHRFATKKALKEDDAVEKLRKNLSVDDGKGGSIIIKLKANEPKLAADIINAMLDNLESLMVTGSKKQTDFIAKKLDETNRDLDAAEERLTRFMQRNNVTAIDDETKAYIQQMESLDSQLLDLDSQIEAIKSSLSSEGNLDTLVGQEVKLKSVEASREYVAKKRQELGKKLSNLPAMATRYAQLQREVSVLTQTYELLTQQYQMANITQKGEDGDYQVIDRARPNDKKVGPRTLLNTAVGGIMTFLFFAVVINLKEVFSRRKPRKLVASTRAVADSTETEPIKRS